MLAEQIEWFRNCAENRRAEIQDRYMDDRKIYDKNAQIDDDYAASVQRSRVMNAPAPQIPTEK